MALLLDGNQAAARILERVAQRVRDLAARGVRPGLAAIQVGDDPASSVYVGRKMKACAQAGVHSEVKKIPPTCSEAELLAVIEQLNADPAIHGILLQLPLPKHLDAERITQAIAPGKDVDGFTWPSLGALMAGHPGFLPCTPAGMMHLLDEYKIPLAGRHAVVVGRSAEVGKPMALLLLARDATVTVCHSRTADLAGMVRQADILIVAAGRAGLVKADMVKAGAVVVDVGINRMPDGKLRGDVDFEAVKLVAGAITPVPGGVGPMTVAMVVENTVAAAARVAAA